MKKKVLLLILFVFAGTMMAQEPSKTEKQDLVKLPRPAQRKFQILVKNERKVATIQDTNERLIELQQSSRGEAQRGLLGDLLWQGFTSAFKQKTVNASSNLVSLGINYATEA